MLQYFARSLRTFRNGATALSLSSIDHSLLGLLNLLCQFFDSLSDMLDIIGKFPLCSMISEQLDLRKANLRFTAVRRQIWRLYHFRLCTQPNWDAFYTFGVAEVG